MKPSPLRAAFRAHASRVRRAVALRLVLDVTVWAALPAAIGGGAAWFAGRPWGGLAVAVGLCLGAGSGAVLSVRRRWSDSDVALFLDARLSADETLSTALEREGRTDEVSREIERRAMRSLAAAGGDRPRPRVTRRRHAAVPVALAAALCLAFVPARPTTGPRPRSEDRVTAKLEGLRRVEALKALDGATPEEKKRFEAMAEAAKKLAEQAKAGVDRKEALDALARLRDGIQAERHDVGDAKNRAGLDAAVRALAQRPETEAAARALGKGDLQALDDEMERLANKTEARAREAAKAALDEALAAARSRNAEAVTRALEEQRRLLDRRTAQSEAMAELGKLLGGALGGEAGRHLATLDRGTAEAREVMARAMVDALKKMSDADRKKVAEAMARSASGAAGGRAATREEMEKLAKELASPEGQASLERALEDMASGARSEAARQSGALAGAELGVTQAERELGGAEGGDGRNPGDGQGNSPGKDGNANTGNTKDGTESGNGPSGSGRGAHPEGSTPAIAGSSLPARTGRPVTGGVPLGDVVYAPGRAGDVAARVGTGALEAAAAKEIGAVERSDVPREYRDQVGRYFAPR